MRMLENDIAKTCVQFLELDGWRAIKMEAISRREWGKGTGEIGQADYLLIRYLPPAKVSSIPRPDDIKACAEVLWVEWKAKRGLHGQKQDEWQRLERARGALVWVAKKEFPPTIEGFQEHYADSGLLRNQSLRPRRELRSQNADLRDRQGVIS